MQAYKFKKMKNLIIIAVVFLASFSVQGQEKKNKNAKYTIEVFGICGDCEKRIEDAAFSVSGVKSADWNREDNSLKLILNEQKTSLDSVQMSIAKAGYDTPSFKSLDTDYQNLPKCCQYERK